LNALAILKIQVHRDCGKEFADHPRFTLATSIEVCFCDPQSPWQRGSIFEEGPVLAAQSGRPRDRRLR
jgi:IS30 family transposase